MPIQIHATLVHNNYNACLVETLTLQWQCLVPSYLLSSFKKTLKLYTIITLNSSSKFDVFWGMPKGLVKNNLNL